MTDYDGDTDSESEWYQDELRILNEEELEEESSEKEDYLE